MTGDKHTPCMSLSHLPHLLWLYKRSGLPSALCLAPGMQGLHQPDAFASLQQNPVLGPVIYTP